MRCVTFDADDLGDFAKIRESVPVLSCFSNDAIYTLWHNFCYDYYATSWTPDGYEMDTESFVKWLFWRTDEKIPS